MNIDEKVLNYMLQGSVETNQILRELEAGSLIEAILPRFKKITRTVTSYYKSYKKVPTYKLLEEELLENFSDIQTLQEVGEEVCEAGEIDYYIKELKFRFKKELSAELAEWIVRSEEEADEETVNSFEKEIRKLGAKLNRISRNAVFVEGDTGESADERLESYKRRKENPEQDVGVSLGLKAFEEYIKDLRKAEVFTVVGPSNSGKSMLLLTLAVKAWLGSNDPTSGVINQDTGCNVFFASLEMPSFQIEQRIDASISGLEYDRIDNTVLDESEMETYKKVLEFQKNYKNKFFIVDMPRGSTAADIEARYENAAAEMNFGLMAVDYVGIMGCSKNGANSDWERVGAAIEELTELVRRCPSVHGSGIPLLTAAQRKAKQKTASGKTNNSEDLESVGRSKIIGDTSDFLCIIHKRGDDVEEALREDAEISLVKNRRGKKGKLYLQKDFARSRFTDLPMDWVGNIFEDDI